MQRTIQYLGRIYVMYVSILQNYLDFIIVPLLFAANSQELIISIDIVYLIVCLLIIIWNVIDLYGISF